MRFLPRGQILEVSGLVYEWVREEHMGLSPWEGGRGTRGYLNREQRVQISHIPLFLLTKEM